ncbi:MAG: FAD-dependent monooxygenase [Anaerolineae bacterium]|nr:FAD-dependent monooxygenase [Anaerolineae bacterium]
MSKRDPLAIRGEYAVVIGGSVAGLLAARVLADHFERVTVVERDHFPAGDGMRKGVPQGLHPHVLLARGREILETLFPGLTDELVAAGAVRMNFTADLLNLSPMGWGVRFPSAIIEPALTRPLLESRIRRHVAAHPRLSFVEGCDVVGLLAAHGRDVDGVRIRQRGQTEGEGGVEDLAANLVVDASGRTSRSPQWLQELGYPAVAETVINSFLGYSTATFEPLAGFEPGWKGLYIQPAPPTHLRGGVIWPVEGGRWMVGLVGMARDYPPTDEAEFMAFARSLRTPIFYEAIRNMRRLTPIAGYRTTENRLRHYERLVAWPGGFVVVGDAVCAFNPVYGQGMSAAAMGALELDGALGELAADGATGAWGQRFQKRLAARNASVWQLATGADLRSPATEGALPGPLDRLMYRYLDRVFLRSTVDPQVALTVVEVLHLQKPASALLHPRILWPTLQGVSRSTSHPQPT